MPRFLDEGVSGPDEQLILRCSCSDMHFVIFDLWRSEHGGFVDMVVTEAWRSPAGLWDRIKAAWVVFWKSEYHGASVSLSPEDMLRVAEWNTTMLRKYSSIKKDDE